MQVVNMSDHPYNHRVVPEVHSLVQGMEQVGINQPSDVCGYIMTTFTFDMLKLGIHITDYLFRSEWDLNTILLKKTVSTVWTFTDIRHFVHILCALLLRNDQFGWKIQSTFSLQNIVTQPPVITTNKVHFLNDTK